MTLENDAVAGATIELLDARLRRLSYLLTGDTHWTGEPSLPEKPDNLEESISRRLLRLERDLEKLSRNIPAIRDVIQLRTHFLLSIPIKIRTNRVIDDRFPDLFHSPPTTNPETIPETLTNQNLASIVLSYASAFPETASRLTSLNDLPIPDAQCSAALIELQPQLDRVARGQEEQARDISELRMRTAKVLQRWYEIGLVGGGECWAEWEGRLEDVEREMKREEVVRERREKEV